MQADSLAKVTPRGVRCTARKLESRGFHNLHMDSFRFDPGGRNNHLNFGLGLTLARMVDRITEESAPSSFSGWKGALEGASILEVPDK